MSNKKKKRKSMPKAVKVTVWNKYIGANKAEGKCYVCGRTIHITDFDVGHNKAKARGGSDDISNLRPICRTCNLSMGTMSIETFKKKYFCKTTPKTKGKRTIKRKTEEDPFAFELPELELPEIELPELPEIDPFGSSSTRSRKKNSPKGKRKRK